MEYDKFNIQQLCGDSEGVDVKLKVIQRILMQNDKGGRGSSKIRGGEVQKWFDPRILATFSNHISLAIIITFFHWLLCQ